MFIAHGACYFARHGLCYHLNFAPHKFAADARREGRRCISILQAIRNEADAAKSCGSFFANKSGF